VGFDPVAVRADFPIFDRVIDGHRLVYLDSAATSHKPTVVLEAEAEFYRLHNANAHRAIYTLGEEATELFEGARATIAGFLGAPSPATIVAARGTTEAVNLVAHGWGRKFLGPGDEVLLTEMEHHSNIVPWQLAGSATGAVLRYIPLTDDGQLDLTGLEGLLTERTKLLAVTGMSNALGTIPPLRRLIDAAHAVGAVVLVDGAQLVPHHPVDVAALDCDFLTFSGHKMLGPTASGGLYGKYEVLESMDPFLGGGEMIMEVTEERSTYKEPPFRFEAGTMNIAQQIGLAAAVRYLEQIGMDTIRDHERALTRYAIDGLQEMGARIIGPTDSDERGGEVSFSYHDIHPHDLATSLSEDGIAVRAGHHCAQLVMRRYDLPATTRASLYLYNTTDDVDALLDGLEKAGAFFGD
jgi:cysteine desulfurase / selenocysteine lyase